MTGPAGSPARGGAAPGDPVSWSTWREAVGVLRYRPHLIKTTRVAVVVGAILFSINQLDVVLRHAADGGTYLKAALTVAVPFCVSNYGILVATRRPRGD